MDCSSYANGMSEQTPTTRETDAATPDSQTNNVALSDRPNTPLIVDSVIESTGFGGPPDKVRASVVYQPSKVDNIELETTVVFDVDDNYIAHFERTEGDGTIAEQYIPIAYAAQEAARVEQVAGIAGVPGIEHVQNQITEVQTVSRNNPSLGTPKQKPALNGESDAGSNPENTDSERSEEGSNQKPQPNKSQSHPTESPKTEPQSGVEPEPETNGNHQDQAEEEDVDSPDPDDSEPTETPANEQSETNDETEAETEADTNADEDDNAEERAEPRSEVEDNPETNPANQQTIDDVDPIEILEDADADHGWSATSAEDQADDVITAVEHPERGVNIAIWDMRYDPDELDFITMFYHPDGSTVDEETDSFEEATQAMKQWVNDLPEQA